MDKNKKKLVLMIVAILGLIVITAGVTYAFFSYTKEGTKDNTITTGTITFLYTEVSGVGKGISLTDAFPITDTQGKKLTGEGNVFNFKVTSTTPNKTAIPYEVTARKSSDSNLVEEAVRIYLTKVSGTSEEEVLLDNYNKLPQTTKVQESKYTEKTIYTGKVPADSSNYEENFRLRMWVDEDTNFSPDKDGNYPYNDKKFTITVNVYANAKVVTEEDIADAATAEISKISVGDTELTKVEDETLGYNYETSLPEGTTSTTLDIETQGEYSTVTVERVDSLAYTSNIKRLSTKKTVELNPGDNYFKITVTSENGDVENQYKINIKVLQQGALLKNEILKLNPIVEKEPSLKKTSEVAGENGLYKSTDTNSGNPTYYFRGNVENYVDFAGYTWRIVRINEDGTIRLIMQDGIENNKTYNFHASNTHYYLESTLKSTLDLWYEDKIESNKNYADKVSTGEYYCQQAKSAYSSSYATNSGEDMILYSDYTPNFKCEPNKEKKGIVESNIGLLTYDEVVFAGGYYNASNTTYYLYNNNSYWTMSTSGNPAYDYSRIWGVSADGKIDIFIVIFNHYTTRPVINLKADTIVTGTGKSDDHFIVQ